MFIFVFFSLCNIEDAITFKHVDDLVIDQVENFVRTKLPRILSNWKLAAKSISEEDYFSSIYASDVQSFQFVFGDRIKLLQCADIVKKKIQTNGWKYFQRISEKNDFDLCGQMNDLKITADSKSTYLLDKLMSTANQNKDRDKGGYRYEKDLQSFATYFRLISGPLAYETLQKNLIHSLPSLPSVNRYIHKSDCRLIEGVLRSKELFEYLNERGLEKVVSLSEDATRIVGRVQYDSYTNQIVGFVLPLNQQTGMPIPFSFPARNSQEMIEHFGKGSVVCPLVNVVMAKPINKKSTPSFCLLLFGTDNKYTAEDVFNRWVYISQELKEKGISVLSFQSDGDPRYLCAMKKMSQIGKESEKFPTLNWFSCGDPDDNSLICFQDTPHNITKFRNFILRTIKRPRKLPFGKHFITQTHLQKMITVFSKDKHNLSPAVLDPIDKQNYESAMRMCDEKVTNLLYRYQNGSEGTAKFLEIMKFINDAFMDQNLTPLERVYKMWYSLFIIRMWRQFVVSSKNLTLKNNFLTINCYTCIELNAHSLIVSMVQLKKNNLSHLFLPTLLNSQPCESLFRQVRSMTSTFSTVTNCSIKEISHRINKIQMQSDIMSRNVSNFTFPHLNRSNSSVELKTYDMPTLNDIYNRIEKSRKDAIRDAIILGLIKEHEKEVFDFACKIKPYKKIQLSKPKQSRSVSSFIQSLHRIGRLKKIDLKNYADKFIDKEVDQDSAYVEVSQNHRTNQRLIVKKTSLCTKCQDNSLC